MQEMISFSEGNHPPNNKTVFFRDELVSLYSGKKFSSWEACEIFINKWTKGQGFHIVKDQVFKENGIVRQWTFLCDHSRTYNSTSNKDTSTRKTQCPFLINVSCPKTNNPDAFITVNKFVDEHNHILSHSMIEFENAKKFTSPMIEDVKFMTTSCKFGATIQRKFLEGKYPSQPIHSKDLYAAIQKFWPSNKSLSNDTAKISNWLDQQKDIDPRWIIAQEWDDNNTLTHLF